MIILRSLFIIFTKLFLNKLITSFVNLLPQTEIIKQKAISNHTKSLVKIPVVSKTGRMTRKAPLEAHFSREELKALLMI